MILAGLDERDALSEADTETLRRELRMLLQLERIQIATAEIDKAEQVLAVHAASEYRRVPEPVVRQVRADRPGDLAADSASDVALASRGHYRRVRLNAWLGLM